MRRMPRKIVIFLQLLESACNAHICVAFMSTEREGERLPWMFLHPCRRYFPLRLTSEGERPKRIDCLVGNLWCFMAAEVMTAQARAHAHGNRQTQQQQTYYRACVQGGATNIVALKLVCPPHADESLIINKSHYKTLPI